MPLTKTQRKQAIEYLVESTPAEMLREVYELTIDPEGTGWPAQQHLDVGLWVRNALREGGFGWDDVTLDEVWAELIGEAAGRVMSFEWGQGHKWQVAGGRGAGESVEL